MPARCNPTVANRVGRIRTNFQRFTIQPTILPDILTYYESEEGQREFREWLAQRETKASEGKAGKSK